MDYYDITFPGMTKTDKSFIFSVTETPDNTNNFTVKLPWLVRNVRYIELIRAIIPAKGSFPYSVLKINDYYLAYGNSEPLDKGYFCTIQADNIGTDKYYTYTKTVSCFDIAHTYIFTTPCKLAKLKISILDGNGDMMEFVAGDHYILTFRIVYN
jgi:hypothetical protein